MYNYPVASVSLSEDCAINGGIAVCTVVASAEGLVQSGIETETATGFVVQGAASGPTASATASATGTGSSGSSSSASATAGSGVKTGASATGSSTAAATTTTGGSNGAGRMQTASSLGLSAGIVGLVAAFFL